MYKIQKINNNTFNFICDKFDDCQYLFGYESVYLKNDNEFKKIHFRPKKYLIKDLDVFEYFNDSKKSLDSFDFLGFSQQYELDFIPSKILYIPNTFFFYKYQTHFGSQRHSFEYKLNYIRAHNYNYAELTLFVKFLFPFNKLCYEDTNIFYDIVYPSYDNNILTGVYLINN